MDDRLYGEALATCRDMIARGSKSFALAARLFSGETRDGAVALYGWCRRCDDEIDGSDLGLRVHDRPTEIESSESLQRLELLREKTIDAFEGRTGHDPVFIAFAGLVMRHGIPRVYALELLEGMAMDVRRQRYRTFDDLLLYCYRVAGTVGLMMSHVMGLRTEEALKNAADLGMAMQLTNIARDVREDFEAGRVYLPLDWLAAEGVPPASLMDMGHRQGLVRVVGRLLDEADRLYRSGDDGVFALPFRAACAVSAARRVYAEIGESVRSRGTGAWDERVVVPGLRKTTLVAQGAGDVARTLYRRLRKPWQKTEIRTIWKPFA